jgi:multimeric flavodoxin WrbA
MKTLIINGSPRKHGDTAALTDEFKKHIDGEVTEVWTFFNKITPCIDCRRCWKTKGCVIQDDMAVIYGDDYENVVLASPVYFSTITPPLMAVLSRFQAYYAAKTFLKSKIEMKPKQGMLILVGGGDGSADDAIRTSKWLFNYLNAEIKHTVFSLKTNELFAANDTDALEKVRLAALALNGKGR